MKSFFSKFRAGVLLLALIAAGSTAFVSCSKFDNDNNQSTPVAGLMAFNLAPDQSALVLALNGNSLTNYQLPYTNYTGGYVRAFPGNRLLQAFSSNSSSSQPIASVNANLEADKYYSAFTIGADNHYRNIVVHDDIDSLPADGKAYVRYVNAIIDSTTPVTVVITANGTAVINQPATYTSVSQFVAVAPGQVNIDINNGGSVDADRTITLEQNRVYTVLLTGIPGVTPAADMIRFVTNGQITDEQSRQAGARSVAN